MGFAQQQDQWNALNVSRETLDKLTIYAELLTKWQKKINLVSNTTIENLWERHFLDSAQVYPHLPAQAEILVDIGCGAGFPGMVLAIMGIPDVHLVDSDSRKMAFVREVARATETPVTFHNKRIEQLSQQNFADVVTSRALASLDMLLGFADRLKKPTGTCLFLKGRKAEEEIEQAQRTWSFDYQTQKSLSDADGHLLIIERMSLK